MAKGESQERRKQETLVTLMDLLEQAGVTITVRQCRQVVEEMFERWPRLADPPRAEWTRWTDQQRRDVLEMRARDVSVPAIAAALGKTHRQVSSFLDRARERA